MLKIIIFYVFFNFLNPCDNSTKVKHLIEKSKDTK